jgi:hypothetical protein
MMYFQYIIAISRSIIRYGLLHIGTIVAREKAAFPINLMKTKGFAYCFRMKRESRGTGGCARRVPIHK